MTLHVERRSPGYCHVTIDNPPINLFDPEMTEDLGRLVTELETDDHIKVVVLASANEEFFISHLDLVRAGEFPTTRGPTGLSPWPDVARRLEAAPFVTIGVVRGRARAVGSELLQALDMRFASRERAVFAQIEIGCGLFPGGGGLERLPRMLGRGRALEVCIGGDDFDADTAALYGWINRALPDAELDTFVERLATRIAGFDRAAVQTSKSIINERVGLAPKSEIEATAARFLEQLDTPAVKQRVGALFERGLQKRDYELRLGELIGLP